MNANAVGQLHVHAGGVAGAELGRELEYAVRVLPARQHRVVLAHHLAVDLRQARRAEALPALV